MQVDLQFPNIFKEKGIRQPFTTFHIKTNIDAKASQLTTTLLDKLNVVGERDPAIKALGIKQCDINLYFNCETGERWWFEDTQRVADIIDSGYWTPQSIMTNERHNKNAN